MALRNRPISAFASHSHLYPGAIFWARLGWGTVSSMPLDLVLSDGVHTCAELLIGEEPTALLAVEAYDTAAGTRIPAKRWLVVADSRRRPDGTDLFRVKARLP